MTRSKDRRLSSSSELRLGPGPCRRHKNQLVSQLLSVGTCEMLGRVSLPTYMFGMSCFATESPTFKSLHQDRWHRAGEAQYFSLGPYGTSMNSNDFHRCFYNFHPICGSEILIFVDDGQI